MYRSFEKPIYAVLLGIILFLALSGMGDNPSAFVVREEGKVYIVDQQGERWDVTEAESLGFKPERFQYGMGRDFFQPLDDSSLTGDAESLPSTLRVLGVSGDKEAKAYSIPKLSRHEIANSEIDGKPIAVGY